MKDRFSLLLLDEGELLLDDLAVECQRATPDGVLQYAGEGRLKVASRSIVFDPIDWRHPIARVPLSKLPHVHLRHSATFRKNRRGSSDPVSRRADSDPPNDVLVLAVPADRGYVEQKHHGDSHPYRRRHEPVVFTFLPRFSKVELLARLVDQLLLVVNAKGNTDQLFAKIVQEKENERISALFDATTLDLSLDSMSRRSGSNLPSLDMSATLIQPLTKTIGRLWTTEKILYFLPIHAEESAAQRYPFVDMLNLRTLYYGKDDRALEVAFGPTITSSGYPRPTQSLMLVMDDHTCRDAAFLAIEGQLQTTGAEPRRELGQYTNAWREGALSNYAYLLALNYAAGRTFNDLSQYPVFPWILADYTSNTLDFSDPKTFRDLSKPMAAINPQRLAMYMERYESLPDDGPRFLCGTHYSCPSFVMSFLVRSAPDAMIRLQSGHFDAPDRYVVVLWFPEAHFADSLKSTFFSIASSWASANTNSADVKELIPEFFATDDGELPPECCVFLQNESFQPGDFLVNVMRLDLGRRQDGRWIEDVELPPWAHGSPETFVQLNRQGLESDHVSSTLHSWIDCIFGQKSRSLSDGNLFYTDVLDSSGAGMPGVDLDELYQNFGRTPRRLFHEPHPNRCSKNKEALSAPSVLDRLGHDLGEIPAAVVRQASI